MSADTSPITQGIPDLFETEIRSFETPFIRIESDMKESIPQNFAQVDRTLEAIFETLRPLHSKTSHEGLSYYLEQMKGDDGLADFASHLYNIQTLVIALHMSMVYLQRGIPAHRDRLETLVKQLPYIIDSQHQGDDTYMTHLLAFKEAIMQGNWDKAIQAQRSVEKLGAFHRQADQQSVREIQHTQIDREGVAVNTHQLADGNNMTQFLHEFAQMYPRVVMMERQNKDRMGGCSRLIKDIHDACLLFSLTGKKQIDNHLDTMRLLDQEVINQVYQLDTYLYILLPDYMRKTVARRSTHT
jgi:hypothetical protein